MKSHRAQTAPPETIGAFHAKTHLARLLREAQSGKSFIITQRGKAVAELRPVENPRPQGPRWGDMQGKIQVSKDFCAPLEEFQDYQ